VNYPLKGIVVALSTGLFVFKMAVQADKKAVFVTLEMIQKKSF